MFGQPRANEDAAAPLPAVAAVPVAVAWQGAALPRQGALRGHAIRAIPADRPYDFVNGRNHLAGQVIALPGNLSRTSSLNVAAPSCGGAFYPMPPPQTGMQYDLKSLMRAMADYLGGMEEHYESALRVVVYTFTIASTEVQQLPRPKAILPVLALPRNARDSEWSLAVALMSPALEAGAREHGSANLGGPLHRMLTEPPSDQLSWASAGEASTIEAMIASLSAWSGTWLASTEAKQGLRVSIAQQEHEQMHRRCARTSLLTDISRECREGLTILVADYDAAFNASMIDLQPVLAAVEGGHIEGFLLVQNSRGFMADHPLSWMINGVKATVHSALLQDGAESSRVVHFHGHSATVITGARCERAKPCTVLPRNTRAILVQYRPQKDVIQPFANAITDFSRHFVAHGPEAISSASRAVFQRVAAPAAAGRAPHDTHDTAVGASRFEELSRALADAEVRIAAADERSRQQGDLMRVLTENQAELQQVHDRQRAELVETKSRCAANVSQLTERLQQVGAAADGTASQAEEANRELTHTKEQLSAAWARLNKKDEEQRRLVNIIDSAQRQGLADETSRRQARQEIEDLRSQVVSLDSHRQGADAETAAARQEAANAFAMVEAAEQRLAEEQMKGQGHRAKFSAVGALLGSKRKLPQGGGDMNRGRGTPPPPAERADVRAAEARDAAADDDA